MRSVKSISTLLGLLVAAVFLLSTTSCTKEELVAPAQKPLIQKAATSGGGQVNPGNTGGQNGGSITDDGDNIGDNERTTKPQG
jgi:hypothetical protein